MSFLIAGAVVAGAGIAKAISGGVQKKKAKAKAAAGKKGGTMSKKPKAKAKPRPGYRGCSKRPYGGCAKCFIR